MTERDDVCGWLVEEGGVQIVAERSWSRVTRRKRGMAQRIVSKIR